MPRRPIVPPTSPPLDASPTDAPLERAKKIGEGLSSATEELNRSLAAAETALRALHLGVRASILLEEDEGWEKYLSFQKENQTWGLFQISGTASGEPEDWNTTPILKVSREDRMAAVRYLPVLLDALMERAQAQTQEVEAAAKQASEFAKKISAGGAS